MGPRCMRRRGQCSWCTALPIPLGQWSPSSRLRGAWVAPASSSSTTVETPICRQPPQPPGCGGTAISMRDPFEALNEEACEPSAQAFGVKTKLAGCQGLPSRGVTVTLFRATVTGRSGRRRSLLALVSKAE